MVGLPCRTCKGDRLRVMGGNNERSNTTETGINKNTRNSSGNQSKLAFIADPGDRVESGPGTQNFPSTTILQTDDLDAFDSDCNDAPSASAVLMTKLFAYDSDVLSEVILYDTYQDNNVIDHSVQEMLTSSKIGYIIYT
ncbi:hypothetical protein Tco_0255390 [Tanacetum coccineum]